MAGHLLDLDIAGELDVSFSDFRNVDVIRNRLREQHRLRVNLRNEPIGILIDIPTALALEAEYARVAEQVEALRAAIAQALDRADDEALAALATDRLSPKNPDPFVTGTQAADELRRLYEAAASRPKRADPR